jgi:carbon-monoxide dehydrogenase medium subunit
VRDAEIRDIIHAEEGALKAPSFAYAKPRSLAETFDLLERHGDGARLLAGGQSLIPSLNMRLSEPEILLDITGLPGLSDISRTDGALRIGALVTHTGIEKSEEIKKHIPLLAEAAPHVAHAAIRNRGTIGGSLALADPAAEYPACVLALGATIVAAGRKGERRIKAADFFKGLYETDLRRGEVLTAVEIPAQKKDERSAFLELARRQGDYAIVGLAAFKGAETRFAFLNVGATPVLARKASSESSIEKAKKALADDLDPPADLYHSPQAKLHLAGVLLERAWNQLSTSR